MAREEKDYRLYWRLLGYVWPYANVFIISIIAMVVLALTDPSIAALLKPLLDGAFIEQDQDYIFWMPFLLVLLFTIKGAAAYASGVALHWVSNKVIMDLRQEMFERLLRMPNAFFDKHNQGEILSRFTYDATQVKEASTSTLNVLVRDSVTITGLLAYMMYVDWVLCLIAMFSTPLIVTIVVIIRKRLRKMSRMFQDSMGDINHSVQECIEGQKLIKIYDGYQQESDRFFDVVKANRRFAMKFAMAAVASSPAVQFITAIFLAIVIYYATHQAVEDNLTVGAFVSFFGAMAMLLGPLKRVVGINEHLQRGLAACESVFSLIDEPVENSSSDEPTERLQGKIEAKGLSFQYQDSEQPILRDVSFTIHAGETVALVGVSGSGKTTLIQLLAGFYATAPGELFVDNTDIQQIALSTLRSNIAMVSQDIVLFNDTVKNNIAYGGLRHWSDEKIQQAAESASAFEFIKDLPQGMNTLLGSRGINLSGGQKQRLAIARALLKDAPVLIFDEATSALDSLSEQKIQQAMATARQGRTCIIIAHRLSTVENADRLIVMHEGRVIETGTHQELLNKKGHYANLYHTQFRHGA